MTLRKIIEYISHLPDIQAVKKSKGYLSLLCCHGGVYFIGSSARKAAMVTTTGEIFNIYAHSTKQIQLFKLSNLSVMIKMLSCKHFTSEVSFNIMCEVLWS